MTYNTVATTDAITTSNNEGKRYKNRGSPAKPHASFHQQLQQTNPVVPLEQDITKCLSSLRTRLGFAQFKMNQGWEKSTLPDVEQLWKQKQQKIIEELPKPRFTQRDIIDKRASSSTGINKYYSNKAKKAKLLRTFSTPTASSPQISYNKKERKKPLSFHYYHPSSPPSQQPPSKCPETPALNSLDSLSYAITLTEKFQSSNGLCSSQPLPDVSKVEPNIHYNSDSPPSSPVTTAAKTIMRIINDSRHQ
ncbi:MAG: hypothetical protein EXX96DRAFT_502222 [Benjaminiella poitrasii]|nr:MAG: hypothetical protein EXX96DRAFT_502222 [Benjaminiella poitrasii]